MVIFGQSGCIWAKVAVFEQCCCIGAVWLSSGKVVVFGQSGCIWVKVIVFGQMVVFGEKWL